jgi:ABC-type sugar transport system ATPase subunit
LGLSDRIAVMREGRFQSIVPAAGLGEDGLINLCYGRAAGTMVA